ncbi:MAG: FAD-dependent monooxygenase [Bryobacteraceae bacterium]
MKTIAILGGGPAGAFAAERIASAGLDAVVLDEKLAWEKPCGGGLTYKAYQQYPFLVDNTTPKRLVRETWLAAPGAGRARLVLDQPLVIYSRFDLNRMLLERAERAGARIDKTRVLEAKRSGSGWRVRTRCGTLEADYCIVATGARNSLRNVGTEWTASDTMYALGYYIPAEQEHVDIQFLPKLEGYIWLFPRCGHLSAGICGKGIPAQALRAQLESYLREKEISTRNAVFYGHMLPALETPSWRRNRVAGEGWLAVGDAGGLVDPITGEGLYYAMRSGDLAGRIVVDTMCPPDRKHLAYRELLDCEFTTDLAFAARLAKRLFLSPFLFSSVPARMIQLMRRSPSFTAIMQDLFAGTQPYLELKDRLLRNLNGTVLDVVMNFFLGRMIPNVNRP